MNKLIAKYHAGGYTPRVKEPNEAGPRQYVNASERENYASGDGDVPTHYRPGSQDFLNWPSHGNPT